jgi:DNA-binding response OmpR family regulator
MAIPRTRQAGAHSIVKGQPTVTSVGDVELDLDAHLVTVGGGSPIPVPRKELILLALLMDRAGQIVSKDALIEAAWGPEGSPRTSLAVHMQRLRRRLGGPSLHGNLIRTVRGYGYVFDVPSRYGAVGRDADSPSSDRSGIAS